MKFPHSLALALAGWYLMLPTPYGSTELDALPNLHLGEWTISESFDTADACESVLAEQRKLMIPDLKGQDQDKRKLALLYVKGACVASNDPRLSDHHPAMKSK